MQAVGNLLILNFFLSSCLSQITSASSCGKVPAPNSTVSSPLDSLILCKSQKLYFRTSQGLFPIYSIDYTRKTLTIAHPSCSSSRHYASPLLLSAGFPAPPLLNSLLLFNCSRSNNYPISAIRQNCTYLNACAASDKPGAQEELKGFSDQCLLVNNLEKLDKGFHPTDLNCSHYRWVYKHSLKHDDYRGYKLGTIISFDMIPGHVPNLCNECQKPNGNCGMGLRCMCHPRECSK
uniref:Wall-associated receptor kinase C-terminal domain-containing protein n=1 Tax=Rhizophora mucronata TaxID=61149 RepID=A0A2P2ILB3_RHIMU